jgi:hypothetical protein
MQAQIDAWTTRLEQDLRAFADRGTDPTFEVADNTIRASWQLRGDEHDALFNLGADGSLHWVSGPTDDAPYSGFLASDLMADFRQLATAYVATIDRQADFVASEARIHDGVDIESVTLAPQELIDLADGARVRTEDLTGLFFVKADAGAGKTTLLREATVMQAERYLKNESNFLFFYVPAQGRELSNLRDAFSGELDELHAVFARDAIATLARNGVLVPVVDGFDELLGTAGYTGAFSSLQSLLTELGGRGTLVVSARSAFYDVEFSRRTGGRPSGGDMKITTVDLQPWSEQQLRDYLVRDRAGSSAAVIAEALQRLSESDRQLLTRPFFASQFEIFVAQKSGDLGDVGLLEHLITAYIEREAEKIVNANGDPVLSPDGHRYLFELVVSEMWENETRQLSESDLVTIADLVSEEFKLESDQATQLKAKVTSYAGFQPRRGAHQSQAAFELEHEVYFDYLLGCALQRLLRESQFDELLRSLDHAILPEPVAAAAVRVLEGESNLSPKLLHCSMGITFDNRRRNLGGLMLAYARELPPLSDVTVQNLAFFGLKSGPARFQRVCFDGCQFVSVDLQGVVFEDCEATTSTFDEIRLDGQSRIDIRGLHPGGNIRNVHEPSGGVYAPASIARLLQRLGTPADEDAAELPQYSDHADALIKLLERVDRTYRQVHILYEIDNRHSGLVGSPLWTELKALLLKHDIVAEEMRESKGANVPGLRLRINIDDLLTGQTSTGILQTSASGLWEELWSL